MAQFNSDVIITSVSGPTAQLATSARFPLNIIQDITKLMEVLANLIQILTYNSLIKILLLIYCISFFYYLGNSLRASSTNRHLQSANIGS